jgi:hypothetical protein
LLRCTSGQGINKNKPLKSSKRHNKKGRHTPAATKGVNPLNQRQYKSNASMSNVKLTHHEEIQLNQVKGNGLITQSITITADFDTDVQDIEMDSVEVWVKEENKAKINITKIAEKLQVLIPLIENIPWRELYRSSKHADENTLYESQYQD